MDNQDTMELAQGFVDWDNTANPADDNQSYENDGDYTDYYSSENDAASGFQSMTLSEAPSQVSEATGFQSEYSRASASTGFQSEATGFQSVALSEAPSMVSAGQSEFSQASGFESGNYSQSMVSGGDFRPESQRSEESFRSISQRTPQVFRPESARSGTQSQRPESSRTSRSVSRRSGMSQSQRPESSRTSRSVSRRSGMSQSQRPESSRTSRSVSRRSGMSQSQRPESSRTSTRSSRKSGMSQMSASTRASARTTTSQQVHDATEYSPVTFAEEEENPASEYTADQASVAGSERVASSRSSWTPRFKKTASLKPTTNKPVSHYVPEGARSAGRTITSIHKRPFSIAKAAFERKPITSVRSPAVPLSMLRNRFEKAPSISSSNPMYEISEEDSYEATTTPASKKHWTLKSGRNWKTAASSQ